VGTRAYISFNPDRADFSGDFVQSHSPRLHFDESDPQD